MHTNVREIINAQECELNFYACWPKYDDKAGLNVYIYPNMYILVHN